MAHRTTQWKGWRRLHLFGAALVLNIGLLLLINEAAPVSRLPSPSPLDGVWLDLSPWPSPPSGGHSRLWPEAQSANEGEDKRRDRSGQDRLADRDGPTAAPHRDVLAAQAARDAAGTSSPQQADRRPSSEISSRWRVAPTLQGPNRPFAGAKGLCAQLIRDRPAPPPECLEELARQGDNAQRLTGSGDGARDAVFERHGRRRLAAYEARRASPASGDPPCETPHPMAGCQGVNISVELFSSRDGLLPNQRARRQ